jgi:16S rRNA (uracil1498-N3)-methyltransferase
MSRRRWIADRWTPTAASLHGEQADHLIRVLRAEIGTEYEVVAGERVWHARIASIRADTVEFDLLEEVPAAPALPVTLMLSVFKFDRMEWAIEKCVELGVDAIQPVITRRTEKHLAQSAGKRAERWRRVALEAAKQSRASAVPAIHDPLPLKAALAEPPDSPSSTILALRLLLDETEHSTMLAHVLKLNPKTNPEANAGRPPIHFAVGPEGGWTTEELALFRSAGWQSVGLGPRILRAETAAIAAIAIIGAATA